MTTRGVDISKYNGNCDFNKAKASGLDFVIIKAGSGVNPTDSKFEEYYKKAKEAGMGVGAYWYCYAKNVDQAKKEANQFLERLQGKQFDYPVYLDFEDPSQSSLGNKLRTDIVVAFCEILERAGYYVGVYSMKSWFDNSFDISRVGNYDLWVACWGSQSHGYTGKGNVGIWQYTNRAHFNGIGNTGEGGVDANIAYLDYPNIIKTHGLNGYKKQSNSKTSDNVTYESNEAQKMINKMRAWLGKSEANGQHKDIIDIYNNHRPLPQGYKVKYTDEWCATTISAAAIQCGLVDKIGKECSVQRFIEIFKNKGIWLEEGTIIPQRGDIICYNWDDTSQPNDGWADHIGLVEKVIGNSISVIEGNANEVVARKVYKVGSGVIRGYARPKYIKQQPAEPTIKQQKTIYDLVTYANEIDRTCAEMIETDLGIPSMSVESYLKVQGKYKNIIHIGGQGAPEGTKRVLAGKNRKDTRKLVQEFIDMYR